MKAKHAVVLFVFGLCADFIGALLKIMHWAGADALLIMGMTLKVIGALAFLYKLVTHPKVKDFLYW
ncbi:GldL-related protein [Hymenobacter sp. PAMC 26628]|uniref:GldL-related protein n=1 Tax=Hymenobacter sp. PAMC 26628 TaxID=1484118 RepID=UPI00076FFE66|nr:hypothetical protein [Hymenobacter sp. PAMC 26628]AMJ66227.1 hypothetical protein AXW84_12865 [Hymenobacter sp. PAMC 26628]